MTIFDQCNTLISLIRHGVEAWRDGDGDANTARATLSNVEQLDKRIHQLAEAEDLREIARLLDRSTQTGKAPTRDEWAALTLANATLDRLNKQ